MMQPHTSSQHPLGVDQDAIAVHNVTRTSGGDERHKVGKLLPLAGDWGGGGGSCLGDCMQEADSYETMVTAS